ncbi:MAG: hypothetical protein ACRD1C_03075 [Terriglobales bacterium]
MARSSTPGAPSNRLLALAPIPLALVLAFTSAAQVVRAQCAGQPPPRRPPEYRRVIPRGQPLNLVLPSDPDFDAQVALAFPSLTSDPAYQNLRPFLLLLHNETGRYARAYAIHWKMDYGNEPYGAPHSDFLNRSVAPDPAALRGIFTQSIPPGRYRLMSPKFSLGQRRWLNESKTFLSMLGDAPVPGSYTRVTANLDAVVWGDGSFYGPNVSNTLEFYYAERDAWHDEGLAIQNLLACGDKEAEIAAALKRHEYRGLNDYGTHQRAWYIIGRRNASIRFQTIWQRSGYGALQRTTAWVANFMPPHDKLTPLGQWYAYRFRLHGYGPKAKERGVPGFGPGSTAGAVKKGGGA